jgi:hypothetical protein
MPILSNKLRLETISNVAVIIVAAVFVGTSFYDRFLLKPVPPAIQQLVGKQLPLPNSLVKGKNATIILFVSKDCHFCSESMIFYQQLSHLRSTLQCDLKLNAIGPQERETRKDIDTYLSGYNLKVDGTDVVNFNSLNIAGTPTLVVQDSLQIVQGVWVGKLPLLREGEVLSKVKSFCRL